MKKIILITVSLFIYVDSFAQPFSSAFAGNEPSGTFEFWQDNDSPTVGIQFWDTTKTVLFQDSFIIQPTINNYSNRAFITVGRINNWNEVYSWGDHSAAGYVSQSGSYSNPSWITSLSNTKITYTGSVTDHVRGDGSIAPFPDIDAIPIGTTIEGYWANAPDGYLLCRGGTIGDATSGATVLANALAEDLFLFLWNNIADAELSVSGGRGASAAADWDAHKTIELPDERGRFSLAKSTSGTGSTLAGVGGQIDMVYSIDPPNTSTDTELSHNHSGVTGTPSGTSGQLVGVINVASSSHTHSIASDGEHNHDVNIEAFNTTANNPAFISKNIAIKY